jgi:hypothetical protein
MKCLEDFALILHDWIEARIHYSHLDVEELQATANDEMLMTHFSSFPDWENCTAGEGSNQS